MSLILISSGRRVQSSQVEDLRVSPHHIFGLVQLITVEATLIDHHSLLHKGNGVTKTKSSTRTSAIEDGTSAFPIKDQIGLEPASSDDDGVITGDLSTLLGVAVVESGLGVEDGVGGALIDDKDGFGEGGDLLLDLGEGLVELVLLAQGVAADEVEVSRVALRPPHPRQAHQQ